MRDALRLSHPPPAVLCYAQALGAEDPFRPWGAQLASCYAAPCVESTPAVPARVRPEPPKAAAGRSWGQPQAQGIMWRWKHEASERQLHAEG